MAGPEGNIVVLAPMGVELKAIVSALGRKGFAGKERGLGRMRVSHFPDLAMDLAVAGHGKTQFGIQAQYLIHQLPNVRGVICAGCAGSLDPNIKVNDVVAAERTIEHDFRLRFVNRPLPAFPGDPGMLKMLRAVSLAEFGLHFGTIASGDEDVLDVQRSKELRELTGAVAVAWEGAGGARAAAFNQIPYLEIRGITDTADHLAIEHFSRNFPAAMENVTRVLMALATIVSSD